MMDELPEREPGMAAFGRWNGTTPAQYRRSAQTRTGPLN
jgi:hypothetical protein